MNFSKECRSCSVEVDTGTGVFFQPNIDEYAYILTAKHNLYEDKKCLKPKNIKDIKLISFDKKVDFIILKKYELEECSKDFAILKIKKVEIFSPKLSVIGNHTKDECYFYGFPSNRRNRNYKREEELRNFKLEIVDILNDYEIIVENDKYYEQVDISGCSGGGVFKNIDNNSSLIGIEFRMDAVDSDKDSNNTRLRFIPIKAFDEIVEKYSDELVYLDENKNIEKLKQKNTISETITLKNGKSFTLEFVKVKLEDDKTLYVGKYPVTFEEYDLFCKEVGKVFTFLKGYENKPVGNVNWNDSNQYCKWLSKKINQKCTLINSKDWEILEFYISKEKNINEWCQDGVENEKKIKTDFGIELIRLDLKNLKISFRYNILS